jgi:hypothetical protein
MPKSSLQFDLCMGPKNAGVEVTATLPKSDTQKDLLIKHFRSAIPNFGTFFAK